MKAWLVAWQFLTRLPLTIRGHVDESDLAASVSCFPAVGAVLGATLYLCGWQASRFLPPLTTGLLLVALQILVTGGLHLDGICDLSDGWYGSRDKERRLEIMKDSRLGALGATSLLLVVMFKASLLATPPADWRALVLYEAGAKFTMALAIAHFPYARRTGTGGLFKQVQTKHVLAAAILPLLLLVLAPWQIALAAGAAWLGSWLLANCWSKALGGLTGDCYGAIHELWQVMFLLALEVIR